VSMMNPLAGPAGPGKFSTRTDNLQMGSTAYGEGKETADINTAAPKATTRGIADDVGGRPVSTPLTGLYADTERANEPITSGIDRGEGVGSSALRMDKVTVKLSDSLAALLPFDNTGEVAVLYQEALAQGN
jgi:hypothetical protein